MQRATLILLGAIFAQGLGIASAQDEIAAEIQHTNAAPVIDGLGDDAVWQQATPHDLDEFFVAVGEELDGPEDASPTWRALWDEENLYVFVEVVDDELVNDESCNWADDSIELYIDAQNLDVEDFRPDQAVDEPFPTYQFTAIAGNAPDEVCGFDIPEDGTSIFTLGINSYDGDDEVTRYPQGSDVSVSKVLDDGRYTLEVAFPWAALEETPAGIMARGEMGFGVAVNDDDDGGDRDTQLMWATEADDLWRRSASFPSVSLVGSAAEPGDFDADGDLDEDDVNTLLADIAAGANTGALDVTGDGSVDALDLEKWVKELRKTWFGDATLDGVFNTTDLITVFQAGKFEVDEIALWSEGDFTGDLRFNTGDLLKAFQDGGFEAGPVAGVSAVPEPNVTLLLLGGIMSFLVGRRRRNWRRSSSTPLC